MTQQPGLKIGKIFGIPIYLHASWIFIFGLFTYSLAMQFGHLHPEWTVSRQWVVGTCTSLLFFGSVVFHELSHSVVAQHYKIRVLSITLFIFGGVARIARDPSKAMQEFNIATAGPVASFLLAGIFVGLRVLFPGREMVGAVAGDLAWTNLMLGAFNLLPGFPLDGGRIFRAMVWGITKDHAKATRMSGASGKIVAYGMIAYGASFAFRGQWSAGLWPALLGLYLLSAARESLAQLVLRESLAGLRASDVMSNEIPSVPCANTLEDYGAEVLRTGRRCHLVITADRLVGMMNVNALNSVPRAEWPNTSIQAVMMPREKILWASPEEPLLRLLERLMTADVNQMPVVNKVEEEEGAQIVGMVTRDSILRVMQNRAELGRSLGK
jgi:Zn-dependent protease